MKNKDKEMEKKYQDFYNEYPNLIDKEPQNVDDRVFRLFDISENKLMLIICIALVIIGFININSSLWGLYYFGLVFFLAGFFAGSNGRETLIFLFSHGIIGLGFMVATSVVINLNIMPLLMDGFNSLHAYLIISIITLIVATILTIRRSIHEEIKKIKYSQAIPLVIYFIGIFMLAILPKIYMFIYKL